MGFASKVEIGGSQHSLASSLYGTCTTSSGTAAKIVTCPDFDTLIVGTMIAVKFVYSNTAANPTLNVNGLGALPIYTNGTNPPGATPQESWAANSVVTFLYDGSAWLMSDNTMLASFRAVMLETIYPVGSIYMSVNEANPGVLFGGTWEQIKDKFLLSSGDTYAAGAEGGSPTVALAEANLPSHRHSIPALSGTAASNGSHTHGGEAGGSPIWVGTTRNSDGIADGKGFKTSAEYADWWTSFKKGLFSIASNGAHTHSVTTTANNSGYTGSGTAHENMPPYLAVYVWKRTA